jgi:DNA-binding transcriptional MerR regulator
MTVDRFFSVTDSCRELGIEPHVLRYWEKEFEIGLKRNSAGRRIVSAAQLAKLQLIKHLLHREKLTIKGARRRLAQSGAAAQGGPAGADARPTLLWIKKELLALKSLAARLPAD